jgi:hypothetical protein
MIKNKMFYEILPNVPIFINFEKKLTCKIISSSVGFEKEFIFLPGKWEIKLIKSIMTNDYYLHRERLTHIYEKPRALIVRPRFKLSDIQ